MAFSYKSFICSALIAAALLQCAHAVSHTVGGSAGWTIPSSASLYSNYASSQSFKVGDTLVFNFQTAAHNVIEVSKSEYDACTAVNPINAYTTGPATVTLNRTGTYYFLCSVGQHCANGQKIAITVLAATSPAPSPVSSPPAVSPGSSPPATSPAASPTTPAATPVSSPPATSPAASPTTPAVTPVSSPPAVSPTTPEASPVSSPPTVSPPNAPTSPSPVSSPPPPTTGSSPPPSPTGEAPSGSTPGTPQSSAPSVGVFGGVTVLAVMVPLVLCR